MVIKINFYIFHLEITYTCCSRSQYLEHTYEFNNGKHVPYDINLQLNPASQYKRNGQHFRLFGDNSNFYNLVQHVHIHRIPIINLLSHILTCCFYCRLFLAFFLSLVFFQRYLSHVLWYNIVCAGNDVTVSIFGKSPPNAEKIMIHIKKVRNSVVFPVLFLKKEYSKSGEQS